MEIQLETFTLKRYNEAEHKSLKDELEAGASSSKFIHQTEERLE